MGSFVMTGSTSATSTAFDVTKAVYDAYRNPTVEAYVVINATISVAVQQILGNGAWLTTVDNTFTGPASKLVILRAGRQARLHVQAAAADYRIEIDW